MSSKFRFIALSLVLLLAVVTATGQVATSRLEGLVQDESGAVIPGAKIVVTNVRTQAELQASSDAQGRYVFASVPPSTYNLTVEATGFRKAVISNLVMSVGDTVNQVVKMEIGAITESVQVTADEIRVQTVDAQVGRNIPLRDIETLPSLGRSPMTLAVFNSGVQIDAANGYDYSRVNGTRQGSNNATLDGVEVNDPVVPRLGLAMTPNTTDTVAEFRIITSGSKAEYGRNAGGQIEMISQGGSNAFHGGGWDYLRNTALNANPFFSNMNGLSVPKFIQNQFGGKLGGYIFKNKTFFFGDYEGRRTRQEKLVNRTTLTSQLRSGLFRWKSTVTGETLSYDMFANDPRGVGMDPWAKKNYYNLMPDANNFDIGDGLNYAGYRFNAQNNSFNDQYTMRFDHQLSDSHKLFFRYSWMRTYSTDGTNGAEASYPGLDYGQQGGHRRGFAIGSSWSLTPTTVNELRVGQQKTNSDFIRPRLHSPMLSTWTFTDPLGPTDFGQGRTVPMWEITENLTKIAGSHTLKGGLQLRFITQDGWRDDYAWPTVTTYPGYGNTVPATLGPSGNISSSARSDFDNLYNDLLGRIGYVRVNYYSDLAQFQPAGSSRIRSTKNHEYSFFLQDDWKLRPNFTLSYGLRYEFNGVPFDAKGYQGILTPPEKINAMNALTNVGVQKGGSWYNNDWNNFAPRVGFAWDPTGDGKWAVRGGAGIYYDRLINAVLSAVDLNTPGFNQPVYAYPNQGGTDLRANDGVPATPMPAAPSLTVPNSRSQGGAVMMPNLRTPYVAQIDFNIQREILRNTVLELGYVGTHGVKLFYQDQVNQFKIYDSGFLAAFQELQAYRANGTPASASNPLVKMFGSAATAISRIGASTVTNGAVGTAANTIDTNYYSYYPNAGLPDTWLRNFPQFSTMYVGTNDGRSYYNSAQITIRREQGALKFRANYTFSKSMDNWANEGNGTSGGSVMDYRNLGLNRGRSDFDKPHSFNSSVSYTLPVGRNRYLLGSAPRWVDALVGGWDLGVLTTWQSGNPLTITSGRYTGPNSAAYTWAVYNGDRSIGTVNKTGAGVFFLTDAQKAAFTFPGAGTVGTTGRNTFRGPGFFNIDASLSKAFKITETKSLKFRAEAYNALNNVNFGNPGLSIATASSFGKISSTIGPNGSGGARIVQAALRFEF